MSADMSPIEHVWDELGRRMWNRVLLPANVAQLSQMLIQEWNNIRQLKIQDIIQAMHHHCQVYIQVNGGHNRY